MGLTTILKNAEKTLEYRWLEHINNLISEYPDTVSEKSKKILNKVDANIQKNINEIKEVIKEDFLIALTSNYTIGQKYYAMAAFNDALNYKICQKKPSNIEKLRLCYKTLNNLFEYKRPIVIFNVPENKYNRFWKESLTPRAFSTFPLSVINSYCNTTKKTKSSQYFLFSSNSKHLKKLLEDENYQVEILPYVADNISQETSEDFNKIFSTLAGTRPTLSIHDCLSQKEIKYAYIVADTKCFYMPPASFNNKSITKNNFKRIDNPYSLLCYIDDYVKDLVECNLKEDYKIIYVSIQNYRKYKLYKNNNIKEFLTILYKALSDESIIATAKKNAKIYEISDEEWDIVQSSHALDRFIETYRKLQKENFKFSKEFKEIYKVYESVREKINDQKITALTLRRYNTVLMRLGLPEYIDVDKVTIKINTGILEKYPMLKLTGTITETTIKLLSELVTFKRP